MKFYIIILVAGMLLTGSINTIVKRAQNEASAKGIDGKDRQFEHPWFQTWVMFIGEFLCLGGLFVQRYLEYRRRKQADAKSFQYGPINDEVEVPPLTPKPRIFQWVLILPTLFDLAGTTLAGIGLLWIYASVWQMLRGSIIVFTGILSVIFLKRKLSAYHWLGMAIVVLGLALVGTASILGESGSKGYKMYLGIGLILLGQLCSAGQMVVEETFVKGRALPPLQIVGLEGFFGLVIMTVVFLPVIYFIPGSQPSHFSHGSYENTLDAFVQVCFFFVSPFTLFLPCFHLLVLSYLFFSWSSTFFCYECSLLVLTFFL
ncbi:Solute carrier family 35 member F6 [Balamuthia mandrillaris]